MVPDQPEPIATARRLFDSFAAEAAGGLGAGWYAGIAPRIARDDALLAATTDLIEGQPAPNMLFAAVQYLLEDHPTDPLAAWYPGIRVASPGSDAAAPGTPSPLDRLPAGDPYEPFRAFYLAHESAIRELLRSRRVQTNEVARSTGLPVALAELTRDLRARNEPTALELIDLGASAGLTLNFHRYDHHLGDARWGDPASTVVLDCDLTGDHQPPLPADPPGSARSKRTHDAEPLDLAACWGIDLHPVDITDDDDARWLRALIYPTHHVRRARLNAAIELAREHPVTLVPGDLTEVLRARLPLIPRDRTICLVASYVLHQLPNDGLDRLWQLLATHAQSRPIHIVLMAGYRNDPNGYIRLLRFDGASRTRRTIANFNPHGLSLEYLPDAPAKPW